MALPLHLKSLQRLTEWMDPDSHAGLQVHLHCPDHCAANCIDLPVVFLTVE